MARARRKTKTVIRNESEYPMTEVRRLIRFAFAELDLPPQVWATIVHTRLAGWRRTHQGGSKMYGASGWARGREMRLCIGRPGDFPCSWYNRGYAGVHVPDLRDWRDALVAIAAHEGKHVEMFHMRCGRMTTREKEGRCDAYAASTLRRFQEAS